MPPIPRLLPLVAVAIGGVLAINAVRGAPNLLGAAKSFAENANAPNGSAPNASAKLAFSPTASIGGSPAQNPTPAPVCAPTASELAKEAGLSPAELQVLQSLGSRRGELDQREQTLDTQVQLIAAAEAKLDDRIKDMNALKTNIQDLLGQAGAQQQKETLRLITVYEAMKPKDAAARMTLMDDSVRLPMAAGMKERKLADILAQMPADDAKNLTEKLAQRVNNPPAIASAQAALNPPPAPPLAAANAAAPPAANAAAPKPARTARDKPKTASPAKTAKADDARAPPAAATPAAAKPG